MGRPKGSLMVDDPATDRADEVEDREVASDLDIVVPVAEEARHIAPGGWRRAVVGVAVGAAAGVALVLASRSSPGS